MTDQELNDMGAQELREEIKANGLTAGVLHVVGLAEALNAQWCKPWGTGEAVREQPVGSYLKSIGL